MKSKVSEFVDLFPNFHELDVNEQITRFIYFHTVEERRETISQNELATLFRFAELRVPRTLQQKLGYLCGKVQRLWCERGEYSLARPVRIAIQGEVNALRGVAAVPRVALDTKFVFPDRAFKDKKIEALLTEAGKCYALECWNACGILMRIVIERALDALDPSIKAKSGLKDKINYASSASGLPISRSMQDGLKTLHGAKLVGDIVAHHSSTLLDGGDIDGIIPHFRMLLKDVKTI